MALDLEIKALLDLFRSYNNSPIYLKLMQIVDLDQFGLWNNFSYGFPRLQYVF